MLLVTQKRQHLQNFARESFIKMWWFAVKTFPMRKKDYRTLIGHDGKWCKNKNIKRNSSIIIYHFYDGGKTIHDGYFRVNDIAIELVVAINWARDKMMAKRDTYIYAYHQNPFSGTGERMVLGGSIGINRMVYLFQRCICLNIL